MRVLVCHALVYFHLMCNKFLSKICVISSKYTLTFVIGYEQQTFRYKKEETDDWPTVLHKNSQLY
jgi:hypothetical protein